MHLTHLSITDLRQFEERDFQFSPGFNLLVGENGAGKTTIMRAVFAALGPTSRSSNSLRFLDEDIRLGCDHAIVEAKLESSHGRKEEFYFRKPLWGRASRSPRSANRPLVLSYASNEAVCSSMKGRKTKRFQGGQPAEIRRKQEFLYYGSERRTREDGLATPEKRFGNSQQVREFVGKILSSFSPDFGDFRWRFEPYSCSLVSKESADIESRIDPNLKRQVEAATMRYFAKFHLRRRKRFPDWPDQSEVILGQESKSRTNRELNMLWQYAFETMDLPSSGRRMLYDSLLKVKLTPRIMIMRPIGPLALSQLSDGEQRLFSLFVDIARELSVREESSRNIGAGEAVVLIDEIDVHLHPKWQRQIVPLLEDLFPRCQFIATTHSPFVIQSVRSDSNLVLLDGEPLAQLGNTGIEKIAKVVMDVERPDVATRYAEQVELAKSFLQLLDEAEKSPEDKLEEYIERLGRKLAHAQNPAMQAFLELQQESRLGG